MAPEFSADSGGTIAISTPFNFRIHGPAPDCWQFTEHGLIELFKEFIIVDISKLDPDRRNLMPIQYTLIAEKADKKS